MTSELLGKTDPRLFWVKVDPKPKGCWLWTGYLSENGYGRFTFQADVTTTVYAHRMAWLLMGGDIPDGWQVDHLCSVRHCIKPSHLNLVTPGQNSRRLLKPHHNRAKTHCPKGHEYSKENTRIYNDARYCRACMRRKRAA